MATRRLVSVAPPVDAQHRLRVAIRLGSVERATAALDDGADPNRAVGMASVEAGANVLRADGDAAFAGILDPDTSMQTPLSAACHGGNLELVKLLVARGADPGLRDVFDRTPMQSAQANGREAVVAYLNSLRNAK